MKGFHYRPQVKPYTGGEYMKKTKEVKEIEGIAMHYLKKMTKLCRENGAELIFDQRAVHRITGVIRSIMR